jgi:hypothetical protein
MTLVSYASDVLMINCDAVYSFTSITCCQFHKKSSFFGFGQFLCEFLCLCMHTLSGNGSVRRDYQRHTPHERRNIDKPFDERIF